MGESATFDNPLMPNARLRQIYLAMMRLRAFEQSLPVKKRSGVLGLEAGAVASSIGTLPGDLVSDTQQGPAMRFLRGVALHRAVEPAVTSRRRGVFAECGAATALPPIRLSIDRLWAAIGGAASLQTRYGIAGADRNVVLAYLRGNECTTASLRKILQYAGEQVLPIVFVTIPVSVQRSPGKLSQLSSASGVPGISVDVEDAVAIYRVVQESLGRARAGGGPALIECVPFVLRGISSTTTRQTDGGLAAIEQYILERNVATREWIAGERRNMARHLRQPVH